VVHAKIKLGWRALRRRRSAGNMTARNPNPYQRVCQAWRSAFQVLVVVSSIWQPDRLEKGRSGAHIPRMETIVKCDCGAEYKRTEAKFLMPHTGHVSCEVCGAVLESWLESTHVATFELVKRPDRKPA
jgi:hypothetical protein